MTVSIQRCESYETGRVRQQLVAVLAPLGGMSRFVAPGQRVLLKPNFVHARHPEDCACTHPVVIAEVARLVLEAGGLPIVADSPGWGTAEKISETLGLAPLLAELNVPVATLARPEEIATPGLAVPSVRIAESVLSADVVINLPKFKSHRQMVMTMGVKNLFGCVPGRRKAWLHVRSDNDPMWFARMLLDNARAVAPAVTILDAVDGMEGNGPCNGTRRHIGCLMAAQDSILLDRVAMEIACDDWRRVFTVAASVEAGLAPARASDVAQVGDAFRAFRVPSYEIPHLLPISFSPHRFAWGCVKSWWMRRRAAAA